MPGNSSPALLGGVLVVRDADKDMDKHVELRGSVPIDRMKQGIELKHVSFAYNSKQVLFDINLIVPKNKTVGNRGPFRCREDHNL